MYETPIQISLDKGLVPHLSILDGLTQCLNMVVRNGQLTTLSTKSAFQSITAEWPFPQLFKLGHEQARLFLCTIDSIYELVISGSTYVLTPLLGGLPEMGYPWSGASIGEFIVFTNNKTIVYNADITGQNKRFIEYTTGNIPVARDICVYNTQMIAAGPWMYGKQHTGCIAISRIANVDFTLDRTNIAQLVPVDYCGVIKRVLATEKGFIAYGSEGVAEFIAEQHEYVNTNPASYRQKPTVSIGIFSQLAVASALDRHCYVGRDFKVREVSSNGVRVLDYDYILGNAQNEIIVSYDESLDEFYITY